MRGQKQENKEVRMVISIRHIRIKGEIQRASNMKARKQERGVWKSFKDIK